jgi:hypothetical protein
MLGFGAVSQLYSVQNQNELAPGPFSQIFSLAGDHEPWDCTCTPITRH